MSNFPLAIWPVKAQFVGKFLVLVYMRNSLLFVIFVLFISACVSNERLARVSAQEAARFNCADIRWDLAVSKEFWKDIDSGPIKLNSFYALFTFPFRIVERFDVKKAQKHAERRIKDLKALKVKKGCSTQEVFRR